MALPDLEFEEYLGGLLPSQQESVRLLRALILECSPHLDESVCTEKWWNGLLVYSAPGTGGVYALGPAAKGNVTLHMMPYYCAPTLQERHGAALKKFLTGKSCVQFRSASEIPVEAIRDIVQNGTGPVLEALRARAKPKPKPKPDT